MHINLIYVTFRLNPYCFKTIEYYIPCLNNAQLKYYHCL